MVLTAKELFTECFYSLQSTAAHYSINFLWPSTYVPHLWHRSCLFSDCLGYYQGILLIMSPPGYYYVPTITIDIMDLKKTVHDFTTSRPLPAVLEKVPLLASDSRILFLYHNFYSCQSSSLKTKQHGYRAAVNRSPSVSLGKDRHSYGEEVSLLEIE
jgi:hypothetical protein